MSSNEETKEEQQSADISNLQESFSNQQKKISALKELVRKSEVAHGKSTSTAQEKVKNIAQRLTHLKSKARSRQSLDVPQRDATVDSQQLSVSLSQMPSQQFSMIASPSSSNYSTPNPTPLKPQQRSDSNTSLSSSATPGSEKILLLRQQMEQNRVLMAQRASSKLHLEQLVTQLKEKFDTTQQCLEDTTELGKSMSDLSALLTYTPVVVSRSDRHRSATDLSSQQPFNLEKERMKFLENRCRLLEKQLEKERQGNTSLHESTVATQSSTKRIKELENQVVELEEALKEQPPPAAAVENKLAEENERLRQQIEAKEADIIQLRAFHENVDEANELANENLRLGNEIAEKTKRIAELEDINDVLETTRCDLTLKNNENEEKLQQLEDELQTTKLKLENVSEELSQMEEHISVQDYLDKLRASDKVEVAALDTDAQVRAEMAKQIQELQDENQKLRMETVQLRETLSESEKLEVSDASIAEKIASLEATIESQREDLKHSLENLKQHEDELMEKTIELNVLNANFKVLEEKLMSSSKNKPLFSSDDAGDEANHPALQTEIQQLKQKLDESNKAMIKLKLKSKQSEKQMEKLKKGSGLHAELVKLEKANEELQQKIIELEDEKGQWQLTQVVDDVNVSQAPEGEEKPQSNAEQEELKEKYHTQAETIRLLEEQKYEQSERLESTLQELQALRQQLNSQDSEEETARVKSEMSEIHLEEQLEEQSQQFVTLQQQLKAQEEELNELRQKTEELAGQKQSADKKLEHYINENIELLNKVEKLSKSSSSAESIEIVERLTQQECAEIDEFHKRLQDPTNAAQLSSVSELTQTEMGPELSESLTKLREESSELMSKIELFTTERREVLEKMEHLTAENHELLEKIEELSTEKEQMETNAMLAEHAKSQLETKLQELAKEKDLLALQVNESTVQKAKLSQELTSLQQSSEVVAALDSIDGATLFDKCEKSLCKLNSELEAYRKANDKNSKFNASKKLAKEAKNAYTQLSELLQKVKEASNAVETVTVIETVVAVTAPNGKALAEYEQLTAQNRALKATVDELRRELQETSIHEPSTVVITEIPAISETSTSAEMQNELSLALEKVNSSEEECLKLQSTVEDLRLQLEETRLAGEEKTDECSRLREEVETLKNLSEDFDRLINDKEMSYEKQIEQFTRLRRELEGKCETYEGEMEILQTLVTEQKHQLIEAYKENEHEINMKLLDLQQRDEEIVKLRVELKELKEVSVVAGKQVAVDVEKECQQLRESLRINKALVAEQVDELSNKQETIDTLNQQIIDLYKTMEENSNKVIEKEDEITYLQELVDKNNKELESLHKDRNEQQSVVDKLLNELHRANNEYLPQLERAEGVKLELEKTNRELEQRNKDLLEKLKKYAANLKKRSAQCQEFETKIKHLEKGALDATQAEEVTVSRDQDRLNELESKLKESESLSNELKEALQMKTIEFLESIESSAKLEYDLKSTQESLAQKTQDTVQLQSTLAASQEPNWEAPLQTELDEKSSIIAKLQEDLKCSEENMALKTEEIEKLHSELMSLQEQTSDWGNAALEDPKEDNLVKELADKTLSLAIAEAALNEVQVELLQMHENEKESKQRESELQTSLHQQEELITELEKKLTIQINSQTNEQTLQQRLNEVSEELKAKSLKFEKSKAVIKERNNQIHRLQAQLKDLQDKLSKQPEEEEEHIPAPLEHSQLDSARVPPNEQVSKAEHDALQQAYEKLSEKYSSEKSNFEETIARLETLHDGIQAKLQEDMSYIETIELENSKYKEKICKLEECVNIFEERRSSMERRANLLDAQMQVRADEYEKTEDELIYRLNMLSDHDDVIAQRLLDSQEEKEELQERVARIQSEFNELNSKYAKLEKEYQAYQENTETNLEADNLTLRQQLAASDLEMQRLRNVYDAKLAAKTTEIDELECELSDQLEKINAEKRALSEDLEKALDECSAQKDEVVRMNESLNAIEQSKHELERESTWLRMQNENSQQDQYELQELRMASMQDKTEIDNLRHQIETLASNHEIELQALRTQISELDTLRMQVGQNQTDDQVFIETENKRLTDLLAEKEAAIENYQRQNLQLQMAAAAVVVAPPPQHTQQHVDPFALAFGLPQQQSNITVGYNEESGRLERELAEKSELALRLQRDLNALQGEFHSLLEGNSEMQRQLLDKNREIENIREIGRSSSTQLSGNDVIPAPPMFFAAEQVAPSPFDDIVQVRTIDHHALEGALVSRHEDGGVNSAEQPTIEDLQRNVSDLEKHAQDLENKLATRNQRENENEERLREMQNRLQEGESRSREREQQLQNAQHELQRLEQENIMQKMSESTTQQTLEQLRRRLEEAEQQLKESTEQVREFEATRISDADERLSELQNNVQHLQTLLQERDNELSQLKRALDADKQLAGMVSVLETQIIPTEVVRAQAEDAVMTSFQPTLDMFFGASSPATEFENLIVPQTMSNEPVVEEVIVPKKSYICHPPEDVAAEKATTLEGIDLGDDWGDTWGSNEAAAEAAHFATTSAAPDARQSLIPREQQLELQLQEESERIQELSLALERCEQQKQELQIKSGKLMKKLKEYKTKIDELQLSTNTFRKSASVESNSMFGDLDAAIQEELKTQIQKLETKLEEEQKIQQNFATEKDKLLKRIDVLTAGNERMSEMKERQDMDVQMYQARIRELQEKLKRLEDWDDEGAIPQPAVIEETATKVVAQPTNTIALPVHEESLLESVKQQLEQKIRELANELQDANGDRQELQALLEDEKSNAARAEDTVRSLQLQISALENAAAVNENSERSKYNELKLELQNVQEMYNNLHDLNEKLKAELSSLKTESEQQELKLKSELQSGECKLQELQRELSELQSSEDKSNEWQSQLLDLRIQNEELTQANQELQAACDSSANNPELSQLNQTLSTENEQLRRQISDMQSEISRMQIIATPNSSSVDEFAAQLQEKESEIMHLKQRIEDLMREDQTEKLVLEILTKNQEIHLLKMQVKHLEDDKHELEHNLSLQITKEIQSGKDDVQTQGTELRNQIQKLELQVQALLEEKNNMEEELKVLNNHVMASLEMEDKLKATIMDLDLKNVEISALKASLELVKTNSSNGDASSKAPEVDFVALNAQWESVVEQKCGEIAQMWREHLEHREQEFKVVETRLHEEITALRSAHAGATPLVQEQQQQQQGVSAETTATSTPASESTSASGTSSAAPSKDGTPRMTRIINEANEADADAIIEKMQAALESQEMEIVTLKEQLAIRSAEYARLAAQYDPFKLHTTLSHSGMSTMSGPTSLDSSQGRRSQAGGGDSSLVPKSELDLALYMLHQRDMRCEEMTLELVSLLEERDTLQLKLSNTLRQVESIRSQSNYVEPTSTHTDAAASIASSDSPMKSSVAGSTASDSTNELNAKLSQLHNVNHSKDKVIKEERDQRIRQMEKIHQDVASLPAAALSELVGTDLSQSNTSPSSVLLNWLWGNKPNSAES